MAGAGAGRTLSAPCGRVLIIAVGLRLQRNRGIAARSGPARGRACGAPSSIAPHAPDGGHQRGHGADDCHDALYNVHLGPVKMTFWMVFPRLFFPT